MTMTGQSGRTVLTSCHHLLESDGLAHSIGEPCETNNTGSVVMLGDVEIGSVKFFRAEVLVTWSCFRSPVNATALSIHCSTRSKLA